MKHLAYTILAVVALWSCGKETSTDQIQNPPNAESLAELVIPEGFNWSSSTKGNVNVLVTTTNSKFDANNQSLWIINESGKRLLNSTITNNIASFYFNVPQTEDKYYAYYPGSGHMVEISKAGSYNLEIDLRPTQKGVFTKGTQKKSAQKVSITNELSNSDFETNSFTNYPWGTVSTYADDGQWYKYNNNYNWTTESGSRVLKAKNNKTAYFSQFVTVAEGDSFAVSADHYDDCEIYILWYGASSNWYFAYEYYDPGNASLTGLVPTGANYAEVYIRLRDNSWVDNVSFGTEVAISDADNDGVADNDDDYPNDNSRAYQEFYPTAGYQTLAFEDLWPGIGDFDFNDMVVSNRIEIAKNANNDIVSADFTISLDAVGAGIGSGLGILLKNSSNQNFQQNIIASISGNATADVNNTNGLIVFDNAFDAQSNYYTNNGVGPNGTPEEFSFTINFVSGVQSFVPDIYIYRSSERGREVHLDGFTGTNAADITLYNTKDDVNGTYNTANGLPWAIEVVTLDKSFKHPKEKKDILVAYPNFQTWAQSQGLQLTNWISTPVLSNVFGN